MRQPLPSLNVLCAVEAAARHRSVARAATELGLTKAAVSHRIRRLEQQLGRALFARSSRGLALTKAGAAYLPEVGRAFANLHGATDELRRRQRRRILNVSATP